MKLIFYKECIANNPIIFWICVIAIIIMIILSIVFVRKETKNESK